MIRIDIACAYQAPVPGLMILCGNCRRFRNGRCPTISMVFEDLMEGIGYEDTTMGLWFTYHGFELKPNLNLPKRRGKQNESE